jgi:hypothetical protein
MGGLVRPAFGARPWLSCGLSAARRSVAAIWLV